MTAETWTAVAALAAVGSFVAALLLLQYGARTRRAALWQEIAATYRKLRWTTQYVTDDGMPYVTVHVDNSMVERPLYNATVWFQVFVESKQGLVAPLALNHIGAYATATLTWPIGDVHSICPIWLSFEDEVGVAWVRDSWGKMTRVKNSRVTKIRRWWRYRGQPPYEKVGGLYIPAGRTSNAERSRVLGTGR